MTLPAPPTLHVFDPTGATALGTWADWEALKWQEIVSHAGTHTVSIPLVDFLAIDFPLDDDGVKNADRHVVKIFEGDQVYGFKIVSEKCQLAVDEFGRRMMRLEDQPGLHSLLEDGVIEPEYGLSRVSGDDRLFGFMSAPGPWIDNVGTWETPDYISWTDMTGRRKKAPPELRTINPDWLGNEPLDTYLPTGTLMFFRGVMTVSGTKLLNEMFTADNYLTYYRDGECDFARDESNPHQWHTVNQLKTAVVSGDHLLAAVIENSPWFGGTSPMGFIGAIQELDAEDKVVGTLFTTNPSDWLVYVGPGQPGWRRAQVLLKCVQEAKARAVADPTPNGLTSLSVGFTATHDSNGDAWDDPPDQFSFPVTTMNLSDVATSLSESYMDVYVDPGDLTHGPTLHAYKRQGTDRYSTVEFKLGSGDEGTLLDYETSRTAARHTVAYSHLNDGTWVKTENAAGIAAAGRIEVGVELGTATSAATASHLAGLDLEKSAKPVIATTGQPFVVGGPVLGVDCFLGDSVKYPGHRAEGHMKLRILMATHDWTGDIKGTWPDGVQDPT